jgi:hypothetical protein
LKQLQDTPGRKNFVRRQRYVFSRESHSRCNHEIAVRRRGISISGEKIMSRTLKSLSALFVVIFFTMAASSAMAQPSTKPASGEPVTSKAKASAGLTRDLSNETLVYQGPKAAVVAVKREGRMQLAGDKARVIQAMQRALNNGKEPGVVRDISILPFEKASYLSIQIEKQGTLYLQLQPSGGGIQEIFTIGDLNSLYCSGGCTACSLVPASLSQGAGPRCECAEENQGPSTDCQLYPRRDVRQLAQQFNLELLAIGFEVADEGTSLSEDPKVVKGASRDTKPARTNPIKRPNN